MDDKETFNKGVIDFMERRGRIPIQKFCAINEIPEGNIVLSREKITETVLRLITYLKDNYGDGGVDKLFEFMRDEYKNNPLIKNLNSLHSKIKDNSQEQKKTPSSQDRIIISYDPKAVEQLNPLIETIVREQMGYVETTERILISHVADYYHNLRDIMVNCKCLILILSNSRRSKKCFEIVYDCAFFRQIRTIIYIDNLEGKGKKANNSIFKKISDIHRTRKSPGEILYYEDLDKLTNSINDKILELNSSYLKW